MAKVKIVARLGESKKLKDGRSPIALRITHNRRQKFFNLGKSCLSDEWNIDKSRFTRKFTDYKKENILLEKTESKAKDIIRKFVLNDEPFSFVAFDRKFNSINKTASFVEFVLRLIAELEAEGRQTTAEHYRTTKNMIVKKVESEDIKFSDIDKYFLKGFEKWLRNERKVKDITISYYMRSLRSIYNKAIEDEGTPVSEDSYPFGKRYKMNHLKTGTTPRATDKEKMDKIAELEFLPYSEDQLAQHIFLFSYYMRGINFIDVANLTEENIKNGRINYNRSKTKGDFSIKISTKAKKILDHWMQSPARVGKYIFPIFIESKHITPKQKHWRKKRMLGRVNKILKVIGTTAGIHDIEVTTYVSRHTYATTLKKSGVDIAKISEGLGHQSQKTTKIYLANFEKDVLDDIDESVL